MPHLLKANLYYGWANQLLKQRFRIPPLCWKKKVFFNFASLRRFQMIQWKKKQKYNIKGRQNLITFMSPKSIWELKDQTKLWQMLHHPWPHVVVSLALFLYCLLEEGWTPHKPALQIATIEAEAKASITTMSFEPTPAHWNKLRLRSLHLPSSSAVGRRLPSSPGTWSSSRTAGCAASLCTGER